MRSFLLVKDENIITRYIAVSTEGDNKTVYETLSTNGTTRDCRNSAKGHGRSAGGPATVDAVQFASY